MNPYLVKRPPEPPRTMPAGWHNDRGIWRYVGDLDADYGIDRDRLPGNLTSAKRRRELGITAHALRKWAKHNGVPCPAVGAIPHRVLDAFEAAGWAA